MTVKLYQKVPVTVGAMRYDGHNMLDVLAWLKLSEITEALSGGLEIKVPGGVVTADVGDWIIKDDHSGEVSKCQHEVFVATYEEL